MSFLRHGRMLQHISQIGKAGKEPRLSSDMPSQSHQAIPWTVALQQSRPPFHLGIGRYRIRNAKLKEL